MLEIRLIGAFEIRCDGQSVMLPSRFAQALFAYLIINAGTPQRREKLAGVFWPESTEARARASLRHELWRIRKALASTSAKDAFLADEITVAFAPSERYWVDVRELNRLSDDASISELIEGLVVCGGELLPGFYDDWIVLEREHLQLVFEKRMSHLLLQLEAEKRWAEQVDWAERWLSLGQRPEAAYRALLVAYAALGDSVKVHATYERCIHALRELGLEPSEEIRALADAKSAVTNLPTTMTSFLGRERELKEISGLLLGSRLVTLTGSGGVGKTRLSIEVARDLTDRFPDGVWHLELASLDDPALVPSMLLSLLRIPGGADPRRSVTNVLEGYFKSRKALVILDNCEHLIEACAGLAHALLAASPRLHILATSREPLRVPGEAPFRVPSLEVPDVSAVHDKDAVRELARIASVKLFVERARVASAGFELTADNAQSISRICIRLDGIPLALELAAGRVSALTPESILDNLNDRFAVLTGGSRTEIPRHQTLRALIDWSHDLLSAPERVLFRRLAVFAGGWSLEAAQEIAAFGDLHASDVLRLLPELVNKSLVVLNAATGRYSLLETVREYALDRLKESGEQVDIRTRHLDYFVARVASTGLDSEEDESSVAELVKEQENLMAAIGWCDEADEGAQKGMQLMGATRFFWKALGQFELGYQLARHVLTLPGAATRNLARRRALYTMSHMGYFLGLTAEMRGPTEESLSIAREIADRRGEADSLYWLGSIAGELGQEIQAAQYHDEALRMARELDYGFLTACIENDMGEVLRSQGKFREAQRLYEQSLAFEPHSAAYEGRLVALVNLTMVLIQQGDIPRARSKLIEAYAVSRQSPYPLTEDQILVQTSAGFLAAAKAWSGATRLYGASEAKREQEGTMLARADEQFIVPLMARAREALGEEDFQAAFAAGRQLGTAGAMSEAQAALLSQQ